MSQAPQAVAAPPSPSAETPLAAHLRSAHPELQLVSFQGALTPKAFTGAHSELAALTQSAGIYDLGYRAFLEITGGDQLRWLNGMATNAIQSLEEGHWNYSFLLNAQGRIQGDANIYRFPNRLLLQTDRSQIARLVAHLDHFIIMDDVTLQELDADTAVVGIAGPASERILSTLGLTIPAEDTFIPAKLNGADVTLVRAHSPVIPRFEIWTPAASLPEIWSALTAAGATPAGLDAVEALRVLEATPLYGVDIQERYLAQETSQMRALNFNKGCYLGQEIVERIRSRATVHRGLRQFSLTGNPQPLPPGETIPLNAEGADRNPVGDISSIAHYQLSDFTGTLALGMIRIDVLERKLPIAYAGGEATTLDAPPLISAPQPQIQGQ
jgi:folate-binding protein YgfZ